MEALPDEIIALNRPRWFVMIAYKRESKAEEMLSGADGLEYYIPKRQALRTVRGRKIRLRVPCIPNLVFVRASWKRLMQFKKTCTFLKFATWNKSTGREYLTVPEKQMQDFIRVSSHYENEVRYYRPDELDVREGTLVRVLGGPLDGVEGVFMKIKGRRSRQVVVLIPKVTAVSVEVHPDFIEVLE